MKFIDIDKSKIPYEQEVVINGETFGFEIYYNKSGDYFTCNLRKNNVLVVGGEKLVYGQILFENLAYREIPRSVIIPYDITRPYKKHADRITWENLNEDVFLYVIEAGELDL